MTNILSGNLWRCCWDCIARKASSPRSFRVKPYLLTWTCYEPGWWEGDHNWVMPPLPSTPGVMTWGASIDSIWKLSVGAHKALSRVLKTWLAWVSGQQRPQEAGQLRTQGDPVLQAMCPLHPNTVRMLFLQAEQIPQTPTPSEAKCDPLLREWCYPPPPPPVTRGIQLQPICQIAGLSLSPSSLYTCQPVLLFLSS